MTEQQQKRALQSWWLTLSEEQRGQVQRLVEDDPVPEWLVTELREAGVPEAADWWPQTDDGQPTTPGELVDFVADQDPERG